ncbi:MAG: hypothetical protein PVSMB7_09600 [Chloroflexota bacterium]
MVRLPDRPTTFHSLLLQCDHRRIVLADRAHPSKPLVIDDVEVIGEDFWMVWFLYKDEPWDICRFYRPDGTWTGYYVDVLEPVSWRGADATSLEPIIDLFLDVWITPEGTVRVLDEDEFKAAARTGVLSETQIQHATDVLASVQNAAMAGTFPPDEVQVFTL